MQGLPLGLVHKKPLDSMWGRRGKSAAAAAKRSPKLERSIALRNVDYCSTSGSRNCRSLDLERNTSFRIDGTDGDIEDVFSGLGLSTDSFEIPAAEWEAMKVRSSSDILPTLSNSRFVEFTDSFRVTDATSLRIEADDSENYEICIANQRPVGDIGTCEKATACRLLNRLDDSVRSNDAISSKTEPARLIPYNDGGGGIKGVRPPLLAPPPTMSLPFIDDACSTWDIVNSFCPRNGRELDFKIGERMLEGKAGYIEVAQNVVGEDEEVRNDIGTRIMNGVLSASCSFTTNSNDDDSSSTTTEPMSVISPNGKYMRIITGWQKGGLLGSGSFGSVYEGIADGGFFFAVKEVSLLEQGEEGRERICQLEREIALLRQFEHENIVQYYGTDKNDSELYIFLELVSKGSLLSLYQKYELRDSQVSGYTRQILHGLKYLHDQNVIHRDIKCANILVNTEGLVKLADFGLAKATKLNDAKSCKGTAFWMAPEVVDSRRGGYGLAADIWSLGCTVLEMLTRQFPYSNLEHMQALYRIGQGNPPHVPNALSDDARDFIHKCLQVDPTARPSAFQLLEHPFVKRPLTSSSGSTSPRNAGRIS